MGNKRKARMFVCPPHYGEKSFLGFIKDKYEKGGLKKGTTPSERKERVVGSCMTPRAFQLMAEGKRERRWRSRYGPPHRLNGELQGGKGLGPADFSPLGKRGGKSQEKNDERGNGTVERRGKKEKGSGEVFRMAWRKSALPAPGHYEKVTLKSEKNP